MRSENHMVVTPPYHTTIFLFLFVKTLNPWKKSSTKLDNVNTIQPRQRYDRQSLKSICMVVPALWFFFSFYSMLSTTVIIVGFPLSLFLNLQHLGKHLRQSWLKFQGIPKNSKRFQKGVWIKMCPTKAKG